MPSFLFIAGIFNAVFIVRAIQDVRSKGQPMSGSPAVALLLAALSEWCWVLPCFVQCVIIFSNGYARNSFACNFQVTSLAHEHILYPSRAERRWYSRA